jgi:putative DNA primase/helicase
MLGYIFMHTNDGKCFFVMGEAPNSGKSLLGNFVQNLFPQEHVSNIALNDLNGKYSLVKLVGAAVNVSLDLPSSELKPTAVSKLKMLTGGDVITAEEKYEPAFAFKNRAKLLFASNYPVKISEADEAFWNRFIYIPFNRSVPPELQDKTLLNKFIIEKDSIVTKALLHAKTLVENKFVFPTTPEIERKMAEFSNTALPTVKEFIDEKCEIDSEFKGTALQDLYDAYVDFCIQNCFTPDSYNAFKAQFAKLAGVKHIKKRFGRSNPISGFSGVKLIS